MLIQRKVQTLYLLHGEADTQLTDPSVLSMIKQNIIARPSSET